MNKSVLRYFVLACAISLLSACFAPQSPQEVTQAFWDAVVQGDAEGAVEYSTLTTGKSYDGFDKEWSGYQPTTGKIVIDGNEASVDSRFIRKTDNGKEQRLFTTHLVRRNEVWLVDYARTAEEVRGGVLGNIFGALTQFGNDLSRQLQSSSSDFNADMERMSKELEEKSNALGEEASKNIDKYGEELRQNIEALKESIDRALNDRNKELSNEDRQVLKEVSADLDKDSDNLAEPTAASVAASSKHLGEAQHKLNTIDSATFADYKAQWRELGKQFEERMQEMLDALSAPTKDERTAL